MRRNARALFGDWFFSNLDQYFLALAQQFADGGLIPIAAREATTLTTAAASAIS